MFGSARSKVLARLLGSAPVLVLVGCNGSNGGPTAQPTPTSSTVFGISRPMGSGTARSFVVRDSAGVARSVGMELSQSALQNLPAGGGVLRCLCLLEARAAWWITSRSTGSLMATHRLASTHCPTSTRTST